MALYKSPLFRIAAMDLAIRTDYEIAHIVANYEKFHNMRPGLLELAKLVSSDDIYTKIENAPDCSMFDDYLEILLDRVQESQFRIASEVNVILDNILIASQIF